MDSGPNLESIDTETDIIVHLRFESKGILSIITIESCWVLYWPSVPWCVCDIIVPRSSVPTRYQAWCQVAPNISQVVPRRCTLLCCNGSGIGCKSRSSITLDFNKANIWISFSSIDRKSDFSFYLNNLLSLQLNLIRSLEFNSISSLLTL